MNSVPLAYGISEACKVSSIGRTTLYTAIKRGDLKTRKVGRRTLITAAELLAWLNSRPTEQAGTAGCSTLADSSDSDGRQS